MQYRSNVTSNVVSHTLYINLPIIILPISVNAVAPSQDLHLEDGGSKVLHIGILPQHYMASQTRRRLESSMP
jgi:hypothetical protein